MSDAMKVYTPKFGIIGGSGLSDMSGLEFTEALRIETPYGAPSDTYRRGEIAGREIFFLPRHGTAHEIQPHRVNYRANIWGFKELGVEKILSFGASGGIKPELKPGMLALPDQVIDNTSGRESTFFDNREVVHIDFTEPFCPDLRRYLIDAAVKAGIEVTGSGVYICVNGPRLETGAEIRTFARWGADMVGMTAMPEAVLAREAGICLAVVSVITNFAAGIVPRKLTATEAVQTMHASRQKLEKVLHTFFALDFPNQGCGCRQSLDEASM